MTQQVRITHTINLPDPTRLARYKRVPELGPKTLFFSGGSALKKLSQALIHYTHNSIHLITPFDSGGSSAQLRKAFQMLAVGDLRNRLMALADQSIKGNPEIYELFAYRFSKNADQKELYHKLNNMILKKDSMVNKIPSPMRKIIRNHLGYFLANMPQDFDLRGASIGNLILAGGYLNNSRHIDPVIYLFSKLVEVKGIVRPVTSKYLHLAAELENGKVIVGQHRLTGKETLPIQSPVKKLFLTKNPGSIEPVDVEIREKTKELIQQAELICYPMGSYYSSIIANLLTKGVGQTISENPCPKVYIPNSNTGHDPEEIGLSLSQRVETLLEYLKRSCYQPVSNEQLLNFVLIDQRIARQYPPSELDHIKNLGVEVLNVPLTNGNNHNYLDEHCIIHILLSLI
ncbi:MAG: hypothetical protein IEMM0008_0782 [bacterium]|nr:MAG: hypothetical protein IEMM0008_0782 [bacterium]